MVISRFQQKLSRKSQKTAQAAKYSSKISINFNVLINSSITIWESALQSITLGLTATPVDFVTRSSLGLFGCEGQLLTSNYDLVQAVQDSYLTPFEIYEHATQILRDGITLDGMSPLQVQKLEDKGEDPTQYDFSSEQVDKVFYNKDTNRAVVRNPMENGINDSTEQVLGKSIIFARYHQHAILMRQLSDEMYPQYAGKFCQVIDNYDPRAGQLIDDFKGESISDDRSIAISVDMLDTGIDMPEIVSLVFAKPVKSPVMFWQMIGRSMRLCPNLFGPSQHTSVFLISDHWGNFARFEIDYRPADTVQGKPLDQLLFEERLNIAEIALQKSEIASYDAIIELIAQDINALSEKSIAVREEWEEKHELSHPAVLKAFAPTTVARLRQEIAPLMQWRNTDGFGDALALDLLTARMQIAVFRGSKEIIDLLGRLASLQMHLNPVREKAEAIQRAKSGAFFLAGFSR